MLFLPLLCVENTNYVIEHPPHLFDGHALAFRETEEAEDEARKACAGMEPDCSAWCYTFDHDEENVEAMTILVA